MYCSQQAYKDYTKLVKESEKLAENAKMFEVTLPPYQQMRQCGKELRLLKPLWDYIIMVNESFDSWNSTPWKEINIEVTVHLFRCMYIGKSA